MTPRTQELVIEALDQALAQHIGKLFSVHMSHPVDGHERFMNGLNQAVGIHENLVAQFTPDKEIEDAVQGRDRADRPQDVSATHEAKTVWEGGWEGVPQHGGD